jgi:hypothetical protein
MEKCNLYASCFFYKELMPDMPFTTEHLRDKYCTNDFSGCTRYNYSRLLSQDNVHNDLFPNDLFMHLLFDLPETRKG